MSKPLEPLKPCPFCGSEKVAIEEAIAEFWIRCETCIATSGTRTSMVAAIEQWNSRPPFRSSGAKITVDIMKIDGKLRTEMQQNTRGADEDEKLMAMEITALLLTCMVQAEEKRRRATKED